MKVLILLFLNYSKKCDGKELEIIGGQKTFMVGNFLKIVQKLLSCILVICFLCISYV